jgi:hypothetical protein
MLQAHEVTQLYRIALCTRLVLAIRNCEFSRIKNGFPIIRRVHRMTPIGKDQQIMGVPCKPPGADEYFEYYANYISQVPEGNLVSIAEAQIAELRDFFREVSEAQSMVLHEPYTWTFKQVVGHLIDSDRVFADRMHRFASTDFQPLNDMDQDIYVENHDYVTPTIESLVEELLLCRQANVLLLRRLKPESWDNRGVASNHSVSVRALAYMQVGHITYHLKILKRRLGKV